EVLVDGVTACARDLEQVLELVAHDVDIGEADDLRLALERVDLAVEQRDRVVVQRRQHRAPRVLDERESLERDRAELLDDGVAHHPGRSRMWTSGVEKHDSVGRLRRCQGMFAFEMKRSRYRRSGSRSMIRASQLTNTLKQPAFMNSSAIRSTTTSRTIDS